MGSATAQLAMSLVLRFAAQGSPAAINAVNGVQQALNNVARGGAGAAAGSNAAARGLNGLASSGAAAARGAAGAAAAANAAANGLNGVASSGAAAARGAAGAAAASNAAASGLNGMASSGAAAARGAEQVTNNASAATRALNGMRQAAGGVRGGLQGALSGIAAYTAGKAVLAGPVRETMSYERKLAHLANTGTPDGSLAERRAGMKEMDAGIMDAVRKGGGSRDSAMATLDTMVASGAYKSPQEALKDLPILVKAGTASGADPQELANIAIRARQSMGITDMDSVLNKAMKAGQLGGFELKDMARWLPEQMAAAKGAGLSGQSGFTAILAANQASVITAGSKDQAGNNLVNLLNKINSADTANDAKKLGIDLSGSLAKARSKGVNGLDAFINLVEQVVAKDARFQDLQKKAKNAKGDEQQAMYKDMTNIMAGSSIAKLIQDRQMLASLLGNMQQKIAQGDANTVAMRGKIDKGPQEGTIGNAHDLVASTAEHKAQQLANEKLNAMQMAMDKVNPMLGGMADWLSGMAKDYPTMAAATWGATAALTALAAAAGAASLAQMLGGRGAGAGAAGGMAQAILTRLGLGGIGLAGAGAVALAGAGGYAVGTLLHNAIEGTAVDDKVGQMVTEFMAFFGNQNAQDALTATRQAEAAQAMKEAAEALKNARPSVHLDGRQLDAELQDVQNFQARRR